MYMDVWVLCSWEQIFNYRPTETNPPTKHMELKQLKAGAVLVNKRV